MTTLSSAQAQTQQRATKPMFLMQASQQAQRLPLLSRQLNMIPKTKQSATLLPQAKHISYMKAQAQQRLTLSFR